MLSSHRGAPESEKALDSRSATNISLCDAHLCQSFKSLCGLAVRHLVQSVQYRRRRTVGDAFFIRTSNRCVRQRRGRVSVFRLVHSAAGHIHLYAQRRSNGCKNIRRRGSTRHTRIAGCGRQINIYEKTITVGLPWRAICTCSRRRTRASLLPTIISLSLISGAHSCSTHATLIAFRLLSPFVTGWRHTTHHKSSLGPAIKRQLYNIDARHRCVSSA